MRPITLALTLTLAGCSSSCGGTTTPKVSWPRVVTCTEPVQHDLLAAVQAILIAPEDGATTSIGDRAVRELTDMASRHGEHVVACLVDEAVQSFERASQPSAVAAAPPEQPARKRLPSAPSPAVPVETLPDDATETSALEAAARGRDFLERVARTKVEEEPAP